MAEKLSEWKERRKNKIDQAISIIYMCFNVLLCFCCFVRFMLKCVRKFFPVVFEEFISVDGFGLMARSSFLGDLNCRIIDGSIQKREKS